MKKKLQLLCSALCFLGVLGSIQVEATELKKNAASNSHSSRGISTKSSEGEVDLFESGGPQLASPFSVQFDALELYSFVFLEAKRLEGSHCPRTLKTKEDIGFVDTKPNPLRTIAESSEVLPLDEQFEDLKSRCQMSLNTESSVCRQTASYLTRAWNKVCSMATARVVGATLGVAGLSSYLVSVDPDLGAQVGTWVGQVVIAASGFTGAALGLRWILGNPSEANFELPLLEVGTNGAYYFNKIDFEPHFASSYYKAFSEDDQELSRFIWFLKWVTRETPLKVTVNTYGGIDFVLPSYVSPKILR